jgi:predicted TIM-barrel fold metal-dependent hydrolase
LAALLRRNGVSQAFAGTFDGLFHKDVHGANARLVDACRGVGSDFFVPIGTVNPTLPDWEEDVRRCRETFKMPGIRLHPANHGYTLDDPRFGQLLKLATSAGLFVQLVAALTEERPRWLTPSVARVNLGRLFEQVQSISGLQLIVCGISEMPAPATLSNNDASIYFELAPPPNAAVLQQILDRVSLDRIVLGSAAPLRGTLWKKNAFNDLSVSVKSKVVVFAENAGRLVKKRRA